MCSVGPLLPHATSKPFSSSSSSPSRSSPSDTSRMSERRRHMPRSILGLFCADRVYPVQLLHNTRSRVPVSSFTSILVHFARVIGHHLCPVWSIQPASRLVRRHPILIRRHPRPVCTRHTSSLLSYAVATSSRPNLDHQGANLSSVSRRLTVSLRGVLTDMWFIICGPTIYRHMSHYILTSCI